MNFQNCTFERITQKNRLIVVAEPGFIVFWKRSIEKCQVNYTSFRLGLTKINFHVKLKGETLNTTFANRINCGCSSPKYKFSENSPFDLLKRNPPKWGSESQEQSIT